MPVTYGYIRVSTEEQAKGTSPADQRTRLIGVAQALGVAEPNFFEDIGVSGSLPLDMRPQGAAMLDRLKKGDTVVAMKMDRMFRDAWDALGVVRKLEAKGVDLILADLNGLTPVHKGITGKFFFTVLAAVAEMERGTINERITFGQRAKAAKGGYTGGKVPYGYTVSGQGKAAVLVEVPEEQALIAEIRRLREEGRSLRRIALELDLDWNLVRRVIDRLVRLEMEVAE